MAAGDDVLNLLGTGSQIGGVVGAFALNPLLGGLAMIGLLLGTGLKSQEASQRKISDLERNRIIAENNLKKMESEKTGVASTAKTAREQELEGSRELSIALQRSVATGAMGASMMLLQQKRIETLAENLAEIDRAETQALGDIDLGKDPDWDKFANLTDQDIYKQGQQAAFTTFTSEILPEAGDMVGDWLGKVKLKKQTDITPTPSYASTASKNKRLYGSLVN